MKAKRSVAKVSDPMKLLALLFVGLFFLSLVPVASASEWSYRKAITIDHENVVADLADFPVLISMADEDLRDKAQPDGDDILFVNADNTIKLDHEIEYFNDSTGELQAWVRVYSLSSTENTKIYMYYGNSECGNQQNATGVWDSKYKLVQHLAETSGTHYDSTSNDNDGIAYNEVTQDTTGQIDGADEFDGSDDYVERSYDPDFTPGLSSWTVEAWVKSQSGSTARAIVWWYRCGANPECYSGDGAQYSLSISSDNKASWMVRDDDGNVLNLKSAAPVDDNSWHHLVGTFDPSADSRKLYVDGYEVNTSSIALTSLSDGGINIPLEICRAFITGWKSPRYYFNGTIDEVRISAIARSGNWINTSYCNQNDPLTFYTVGYQEGDPVPPAPLPTFILSTDTDGDGVPDVWDMDDSTPTGYWTDSQGIGRRWGDMNGDGKLTSVDALMILQAVVGKISL